MEQSTGTDAVGVAVASAVADGMKHKTTWRIERFASDEDYANGVSSAVLDPETGLLLPAVSEIDHNILLNAGIQAVWDIAAGTGTPTAFNAANARIGVGDSNAAAVATQTGLQASSNKTYQTMNTAYPQRSNQTQQWQAVFGAAAANYAWNEFCVDNGTITLNRVVSAQGTKASGQTWTVTVQITLS